MGAFAALFILAVSITGIALLFAGPMMKAETGALTVSGERTTPVDLGELISAAHTTVGDTFIPVGYLGPNAEIVTQADMIYGMSDRPDKGGDVQIISFDPATSEVTGTFYLHRTFTHELIDFHYTLLAGPVGLIIIAVIGILMTLLAIMGLFLWWPVGGFKGQGRIRKKSTNLSMKGPLITKSFRLHSLSGFWLSVAVLIWGLSGTYWSKPDWFPRSFTPQTDLTGQALPEEFLSRQCDTSVTINQAVETALAQYPGHRIFEAEFAAPWQTYHTLYLSNDSDIDRLDADTRVWVHAQCPDVMVTDTITGAGHIGAIAQGLHSGRLFGFLRIPLTLIVGLALILMSLTGLHLWWRRVFRS